MYYSETHRDTAIDNMLDTLNFLTDIGTNRGLEDLIVIAVYTAYESGASYKTIRSMYATLVQNENYEM